MIYLISGYISAVIMIHLLLFVRSGYMSKILLINSAISCIAVAILLLTFYFKDTNFIDVIFFYIIMSPIGFYGIFLYYKNIKPKKNDKYQDLKQSSNNNCKDDNKEQVKNQQNKVI